jgi:acyl-CoA thioesterase-1
MKSKPAVVVVALGANDGLRGIPIAQIEENLHKIIAAIRAGGAQPLLAGMVVPPNYGEAYRTQFAAIWPKLATATQTPLLPFLLAGVAAEPNLNQSDRIHPNAAGQRIIAEQMLTFLAPLLPLPSVPAISTP